MWLLTVSNCNLKHSALPRELHIAAHGLLDPFDVCRDTCDDTLSTGAESETIDANNSPRVLLIFACQWTSAVTLQMNEWMNEWMNDVFINVW